MKCLFACGVLLTSVVTRADTPVSRNRAVDAAGSCDADHQIPGGGGGDATRHEPVCGNGTVETGEECDDGNRLDGDSCDSTCHLERACCCGNGVLDPGEECDDGNDIDNDGCSSRCKIDPMWAHIPR